MNKLLIFPDPLDSRCELTLDNGTKLIGTPDTHSSGRLGQSFIIPDGSPNGNGCQLLITKSKYVQLLQRAILTKSIEVSYLLADDFHLTLEKVCPDPPPIDPPPVPSNKPIDIINQVYATGNFNLATKDGCGKFTEECCKQLHNRNSLTWGHLRKTGAQNQYNGHAVDAVMLLMDSQGSTKAGIYDIIFSSESPEAKPVFNFSGSPDASLWYYPA